MRTPSSSATSPSPPMAYLHHIPGTQQALQPVIPDTLQQDQRKQAVDKFLARAEIAMITRRLRAHLAYASYKAAHNIPQVSLRDLEVQRQSQTASFNRTVVAKRRAVGANNYYNKTASPRPTSAGTGLRRGESAAMAPPNSAVTPRLSTSAVTTGHSNQNNFASSQRNTGQAPNLFASILAPPSTKQARTVHNPNDPPVPAPQRPVQSQKARVTKTSTRNDPARPTTKVKPTNKNTKSVASSNRKRKKASTVDKGKEKRRSDDMDVDGEMDMKAAATLTSLFLHNRPSITGSASSPRSSIDGSEAGSAYSHSHFSQSSTRIVPQKPPAIPAVPSSSLTVESSFRSQTPPRGSHKRTFSTPRAAPTDSEAANLMLFLATSPSPTRATTKESKDAAAFRALASGPLRSKGRVLFQSNPAADRDPAGHEDTTATAGSSHRMSSALSRGGESSFGSSMSSIGSQLGPSTIATDSTLQSQLLPAAPLPLRGSSIPTGKTDRPTSPSPKPGFVGIPSGSQNGSGDLGSLDFNFHDFINASPSPARGAGSGNDASVVRPNVADVGRKLFDGEQLRHMQATTVAIGPPPRQDELTLGASIDVHM